MKQGLDTDAWARLLLITQGYWIAEELGTFRVHAQGASAGNEKHGRGMFDRLLTIRRISSMATDSTIRSAARSALLRQTATAGSRLLVRKTNHPVIQFMRYLLVGGSASIVDFCVYALLARLVGLNIFAAAFVGYTVGFGWNHLLSVLWIFQSKHSRKKEVTLAYAIAIGGLLWTELFLWAFVHGIGMNDLIARFLTMWIVLIWNYTMRKKFVFG
jgi:putative flippase GtrA